MTPSALRVPRRRASSMVTPEAIAAVKAEPNASPAPVDEVDLIPLVLQCQVDLSQWP